MQIYNDKLLYNEDIKKVGCVLLIAMLSFPCFAKKRISLEGNWGVTKSIISKQPIQAWLEDNNKGLLLEFSVNLGTIEVTITNLAGEVVYKLSVESKPLVIISLDKEVKEGDILSITDGMNIVYGKIDMNM
ncbi:DUF3244 domain-containing protein [Parabacteroides johnsonii]|uniref:DUF3244 domain-containing protein n=1 Tax=Parabacteroides johnsonii TaxID=387661 RepID=UPI00241FE981|nr:DUF3244 domain-containing protein [Parabacteroides johnsonii]